MRPARIALFGGTGGTGRETLKQALEAGHSVTALVRQPDKLQVQHDNLKVVQGDAHVAADVESVVAGQEAVFASLGLSSSGSNTEVVTVCTVGVGNALESMKRHGIRRLVTMSTHGVNDSDDGSDYPRQLWQLVGERLRDKARMETLVRASDADWTIVRAPRITSGPPIGDYRVAERLAIDFSSSVSEKNIARFVLSEIVTPAHVGMAVSITES